MEKQDRLGVRTASQLEQKYKFGKSFAAVMGAAQDARQAVDTASRQLRGEVDRQVSSLTRTADAITASVSDSKGQLDALRTQTAALQLSADRLQLSMTGMRAAVDGQGAAVTQLSRHFVFGSDGLHIRNDLTGMGISLREDQVAFRGGHSPTTVITPNEMQTTNQRVLQRLELGDFALLPRTNGNLSMRYTGGNHDTI
jgi:hypothetical protein